MISIFISSTSKDLKKHREAVIAALQQGDTAPIAMEFFGARAGDAVEVSLHELEKSNLFIGIYAHRYGYQPTGAKSVTEMEYDYAVERGMDKLIFIVKPDYRKGKLAEFADDYETDKKQRLQDFKERLNTNVRAEFDKPDNLAKQVVSAVLSWYQSGSQTAASTIPAADAGKTVTKTVYIEGNVENYIENIKTGDNANFHFGNKKNK